MEDDAFYSQETIDKLIVQRGWLKAGAEKAYQMKLNLQMTPENQLMMRALGRKAVGEVVSRSNWPMLVLRNDFAQQL